MTSNRRRPFAFVVAAALGLAALASPDVSLAQQGQQQISPQQIQLARQAASEGLTAYQKGEFDKALNLFEQAKALYPSAQIVRMIGYSLLALEKWEPAADALEAALVSDVSPLGPDDKKDVQEQLAKAMSHIGVVTVTSKVAGSKLTVDDQPPKDLPLDKPLRMPPGKHKLVVTAPEHEDNAQEVDVEGGKPLDLEIDPKEIKKEAPPPPPPPPPPEPKSKAWFPHQRTIGLSVAGVGVGVGLGWVATSLVSLHLRNNVARDIKIHERFYGTNCERGDAQQCAFDRQVINADANDADRLRNWSVGLGIGAGVLVAGGVVLAILGDEKPKDEAAPPPKTGKVLPTVSCGPAFGPGLACAGTF
jgi:hypothetical protein